MINFISFVLIGSLVLLLVYNKIFNKEFNLSNELFSMGMFFWKSLWRVFKIFLFIISIIYIVAIADNATGDLANITNTIANNFFEYYFVFLTIVVINYYVTFNKYYKKRTIDFVVSIQQFINKNFLLNSIVLLVLMLLNGSKELVYGILGGYILFVLTDISKRFKDKMDRNKEHKYTIDMWLVFVVNIGLIMIYLYNTNLMVVWITVGSVLVILLLLTVFRKQLVKIVNKFKNYSKMLNV